jgi:hypothetical protein
VNLCADDTKPNLYNINDGFDSFRRTWPFSSLATKSGDAKRKLIMFNGKCMVQGHAVSAGITSDFINTTSGILKSVFLKETIKKQNEIKGKHTKNPIIEKMVNLCSQCAQSITIDHASIRCCRTMYS